MKYDKNTLVGEMEDDDMREILRRLYFQLREDGLEDFEHFTAYMEKAVRRICDLSDTIDVSPWIEDDENYHGYGEGFRVCDRCKCKMSEGYVLGGGEEHLCEKCLNETYTSEEWQELYDLDDSSNYWTEWYDEIPQEARS